MNVSLCLQVTSFFSIIVFTVRKETDMLKIFTLKTLDPSSGLIKKATFREKLAWLIAGRPIRSKRVVERFLDKRLQAELKAQNFGEANVNSNTFSLPSS